MKIRASYRYQTYEYFKSIHFYLGSVLLLFLYESYPLYKAKLIPSASAHAIEFGIYCSLLEMLTVIFLFFLGYHAVKKNLKFLSQNGVSRKSIILSQILSSITFTLLIAVICEVLLTIFKFWAKISSGKIDVIWFSYFEEAYEGTFKHISFLSFHRLNFSLNFCTFLAIIAFSYMVSVVCYQMKRTSKIILSIVLLSYLLIIPNMFVGLNKSSLLNPWPAVDSFIVQTYQSEPLKLMITLLIIASLCHLTSYTILRKTSLKA